MKMLLRLPPVVSGGVMLILLFAGSTVQGLAAEQLTRVVANLFLVSVFVGWPTLVVHGLLPHDAPRVGRVRLAFFATLLLHVVGAVLIAASVADTTLDRVGAVLAVPLGLFAPLYVFWSAARTLVDLEQGEGSSWDRYVGTFLLFFFLPLGIFWLQGRIARVSAGLSMQPA